MANEKVVLPKEVAEAIENLRNKGFTDYAVLKSWENPPIIHTEKEVESARTIRKFVTSGDSLGDGLKKIMNALVIGYEVDQTPEEKLRDRYEIYIDLRREFDTEYSRGYMLGVEQTLDILGITIEGINDKEAN